MPGIHERGWRNVICCASGPSFTVEQAAIVEAARASGVWRTIATNNTAWTRTPNGDAMLACDIPWWREHAREVAELFHGERWTVGRPLREIDYRKNAAFPDMVRELGIRIVAKDNGEGLSRKADTINSGGNTGYSAIGLAYLFGACKIVLVGYDMQRTWGRTHHHGDHRGKLHNSTVAAYEQWAKRFDALADDLLAAGVDVVNCTTETALESFCHGDLVRELASPA